jgi:leucyl-tRNA synthetase/predicted alpha/beta hydrolase family esterase
MAIRQSKDFGKIERHWQQMWKKHRIYEPDLRRAKKPFYNLMMFPYLSAEGLHVGNMYAFTGSDIYGRFKRMQGYDVFEPIGLDGFGIHSENYALKIGVHPMEQAKVSEKNFYRQLGMVGNGFAWDERVETYDPAYYRWTQWLFVQMFKHGLAYRKKQLVNWCPSCKTVLSDEQVIGAAPEGGEPRPDPGRGKCERCGTKVIKKELEQWFFKITDYAGRLLENLKKLDWPERVKIAQTNWIGRSEGAEIDFDIAGGVAPSYVLLHGYSSGPAKHMFPWLKKELEKRGAKVYVPTLPKPNDPRVLDQIETVLRSIPFSKDTVVVGHSLGSIVALKVLERLRHRVRKTVLVAGYAENRFLNNEPFEPHAFDWKFNAKKVRQNAGEVVILRDTTDRIVPADQADKLARLFGGSIVDFKATTPHAWGKQEPEVLRSCIDTIRVFTTRPDTLFGATYMVLAPEHQLVKNLESRMENVEEVRKYVRKAIARSEEERVEEGKDPSTGSGQGKTGVELKGIRAINPATKKEIPVWVADYVFGSYGTGAIMAVPAHDERDFEFAEKYKLPVRYVIAPYFIDEDDPPRKGKPMVWRRAVNCYIRNPKDGKFLFLEWKSTKWKGPVSGGIEEGEDPIKASLREIREETGYKHLKFVQYLGSPIRADFYHPAKSENRAAEFIGLLFELEDEARDVVAPHEERNHVAKWIAPDQAQAFLNTGNTFFDRIGKENLCYIGEGKLVDSGKFNDMNSDTARWEITKFVGGERKVQYRLRDWLISRQRYWGPPIPMIYCEACAAAGKGERVGPPAGGMPGWYAVPEKDLPVKLPYVKDFQPKGKGESPLASVKSFYQVKCPGCKSAARRETDVSDTFLDSAWYFLRYPSTHSARSGQAPWDPAITRRWLPVNMYIGGIEHAVLHLLYSRFVTMAFHDWGLLDFEEPFIIFRAHGLLIKDGAKMSKSKGNVINPDEYIAKFGADAFRMYLMFLAPFEQGGDFRDSGILGTERFLNSVRRYFSDRSKASRETRTGEVPLRAVHKAVKKVTEDIGNLKYNTAISQLMILMNTLAEAAPAYLDDAASGIVIRLLAPFAPHTAEELWSRLFGTKKSRIHDSQSESGQQIKGFTLHASRFRSVHQEPWPAYDPKLVEDETFTLVIQVNGKVRDSVEAPLGLTQSEAETLALGRDKIQVFLAGQKPRKSIYVLRRLINIVI